MLSQSSKRDAALMGAIALGQFCHLTFSTEQPGAAKVLQGWIHIHEGRLNCCTDERRDECDAHRQKVADKLYDGVMREYPPFDVEALIRIDVAVVASGCYVPLWHHPDHADRYHVLERDRLVCCKEG